MTSYFNTFRPYVRWNQPSPSAARDFIGFHVYWHNAAHFSWSLFGYGFQVGIWLHDVMKEAR
jgi:uncharacterized membrane protein